MLLVRSYRTFAPLPVMGCPTHRRYVSVALSSRSLALGVTQQVWPLGSPDFPQRSRGTSVPGQIATTSLTPSLLQCNHFAIRGKHLRLSPQITTDVCLLNNTGEWTAQPISQ